MFYGSESTDSADIRKQNLFPQQILLVHAKGKHLVGQDFLAVG